MKEIVTNSVQATVEFGKIIGRMIQQSTIITLNGKMGAGKTSLTQGLVYGLGSEDFVTSPTFALVNSYVGSKFKIYHFDMYRISGFFDLESTGFFDYLDEKNTVLIIEWSENVAEFLPVPDLKINIKAIGKQARKIEVFDNNMMLEINDNENFRY